MAFEKEKENLEEKLTKTTLELIKAGERFNPKRPPSNQEDAEEDGRIKAKYLHEFLEKNIFNKIKTLEGKITALEKEVETLKAAQAAAAVNPATP